MIYYEYLICLHTHTHISNSYPVYLRRRPESNLTISNVMYFSHADTSVLRIQSAPCERKKIRIGSLKTCCVKAAMINVHVDLIGMHYPLDAMMVPADFYERRPIVDVMNPKWLSSISLRRLWIGFVWLSHSPKIQQLFTSQLPESSKTLQDQQVCCCQLWKTTLSGQFEGRRVCVF